jgi:hypothetical protein
MASAKGMHADGITDDTAPIQAALDAKAKVGGKLVLPAGKYLVKGSLTIPPGVALRGEADAPRYNDPLTGTIILATGGRDKEDAPALFEMGNSSSVSGLTVYYPEQNCRDIRPYPWTFHLQGNDNTVEDVTLINSYDGIKVGPEKNVRHRIRSVYGCVLKRGIYVDGCTDIGRIDNVQFHGHWWWAKAVGGDEKLVNDYILGNLEAFTFGRTDWEYVNNTFVFPAKIGYHFIQTDLGACNGQFSGIGSDYSHRCVVVDGIQIMGLLITNGEFAAFGGEDAIQVEIASTCFGSVRMENCSFWAGSTQCVVSHNPYFTSLSNCYLMNGRDGNTKPLIEADSGRLQVIGCSFGTREPSIALRKGVRHAIISENNGNHGVRIINEIGDQAILLGNEPEVK